MEATEVLMEPLEVAEVLGISRTTVRELADEGVLFIAATTGRGTRLFRKAEVERVKLLRAAEEKA